MSYARTYLRLSCALTVLLAGTTIAGTPVEEGRRLAVEACGACHQVEPGQKRPEAVAEGEEGAHTLAPTFAAIADRCLSADELRSRITNPHYPMRAQNLMPTDLSDLAAYMRSLARHPNCAIR